MRGGGGICERRRCLMCQHHAEKGRVMMAHCKQILGRRKMAKKVLFAVQFLRAKGVISTYMHTRVQAYY